MTRQPTPVLDLAHDPERLAAIVAAPFRRPAPEEAVIVRGTLPNGRKVYARLARAVVDATRPAAPVLAPTGRPVAAPERPRVARQAAMPDVEARTPTPSSPRAQVDIIVANLSRTPVRVGVPAPQPQPAPAARANVDVDNLLSLTPIGQRVLADRRAAEARAVASMLPPISAAVRGALEATPLGRRVLADRRRRDPEGEVAAAGFDPARRRELLEASPVGRSILREEARR